MADEVFSSVRRFFSASPLTDGYKFEDQNVKNETTVVHVIFISQRLQKADEQLLRTRNTNGE